MTETKINKIDFYFARQYLVTPNECAELNDWKQKKIGEYNIYVHPKIDVTILEKKSSEIEIALIGHIVNPNKPNDTNSDILNTIYADFSIENLTKQLYGYVGKYLLLIKKGSNYFVFNDACGLKSAFYTTFNNQLFIASQPLLLKLVVPLKEGDKYHEYHQSKYKKTDIEHWIPSGSSLYENVFHLVPNHYLNVSDLKQIRYWPTHELPNISLEEGTKRASLILQNTMLAFDKRFKLSLPLTAGFDSRTVLSACKDIADRLYFYTLQYRDLKDDSNDIKIPRAMLSRLGFKHHVIDTRKPIDKTFAEYYSANSDIAHLYDWGVMANGMLNNYPSDRVAIKGSCSEVGRVAYNVLKNEAATFTPKDLLGFNPGWEQIRFIRDQVSIWFSEVGEIKKGYNIVDLFYWEHRMGSWQAQNQLEWGVVKDTVTPFNNRELFDILLSVDEQYRYKPDYVLFEKIMENLWKEVLVEPINPKSPFHKVKVIYDIICAKFNQLKLSLLSKKSFLIAGHAIEYGFDFFEELSYGGLLSLL